MCFSDKCGEKFPSSERKLHNAHTHMCSFTTVHLKVLLNGFFMVPVYVSLISLFLFNIHISLNFIRLLLVVITPSVTSEFNL